MKRVFDCFNSLYPVWLVGLAILAFFQPQTMLFLHDPAIEHPEGELIAAWYKCPKEEIVGESLIRCSRSKDGGKTRGALEVIAVDTSGDGA